MNQLFTMQREATLESVLKHDRWIIGAGVGVLTVLSWSYLFWDARKMSIGQGCCAVIRPTLSSWTMSDLSVLFAMWAIMMVGMMAPSAAPMLLMFAAVNRKRKEAERPYVPTSLFLAGYLAIWTAFSLLATVAQWFLHAGALLSTKMAATSPMLGGSVLLAVGIFQWSPLKRSCLRHCRSPLDFILTDWREGRLGAFVMGLRHGVFCVGCCWLLMCLLFVTGVMNLLWVAIVTLFVLVEKVVPWPK